MSLFKRKGFTLVELLVVIAIIAVIIGMLLPAIQKAREAAYRAQCVNNVKQLGLATLNFADSFDMLPTGSSYLWTTQDTAAPDGMTEGTWLAHLLPYLEQNNLFQQAFQSTKFPGEGDMHYIRLTVVKGFLCPSDASSYPGTPAGTGYNVNTPPSASPVPAFPSGNLALTNYVGNCGIYLYGPTVNGKGLSVLQAYPDGTSNTVLIAEVYRANNRATTQSPPENFTSAHWGGTEYDEPWIIPLFGGYQTHSLFGSNWGMYGPNYYYDDQPFVAALPQAGVYAYNLATPHPGGMVTGLGDGSVRIVAPTISTTTWFAACVPNDGETLGSDW